MLMVRVVDLFARVGGLVDWWTGGLMGGIAGWRVGWLVTWLVALAGWQVDGTGGAFGRLVGWLGGLVDW